MKKYILNFYTNLFFFLSGLTVIMLNICDLKSSLIGLIFSVALFAINFMLIYEKQVFRFFVKLRW